MQSCSSLEIELTNLERKSKADPNRDVSPEIRDAHGVISAFQADPPSTLAKAVKARDAISASRETIREAGRFLNGDLDREIDSLNARIREKTAATARLQKETAAIVAKTASLKRQMAERESVMGPLKAEQARVERSFNLLSGMAVAKGVVRSTAEIPELLARVVGIEKARGMKPGEVSFAMLSGGGAR
jgi:chromosome segregation ATPase